MTGPYFVLLFRSASPYGRHLGYGQVAGIPENPLLMLFLL